MLILALDTTSRSGSVALMRDDTLVGLHTGDAAQPHGRRLPGDLLLPLEAHGLMPKDVDLYAVAVGPGSFTGLRVGVATVQGFAFANRRSVVAVSTLAALAALSDVDPISSGSALIAAVIDADRREVFAALFRRAQETAVRHGATVEQGIVIAPEGLEPVGEALVLRPEQLAGQWAGRIRHETVWAVGSGTEKYGDVVATLGPRVRIAGPTPPLAPVIARVAARLWQAGATISPHAIRPVYVRRPDAELARNR